MILLGGQEANELVVKLVAKGADITASYRLPGATHKTTGMTALHSAFTLGALSSFRPQQSGEDFLRRVAHAKESVTQYDAKYDAELSLKYDWEKPIEGRLPAPRS
jgi:hypothetical protein